MSLERWKTLCRVFRRNLPQELGVRLLQGVGQETGVEASGRAEFIGDEPLKHKGTQ